MLARSSYPVRSLRTGRTRSLNPLGKIPFSSKLSFEHNDLSYVDAIVDPDRERRSGPKSYPQSAIFAALPVYLSSMGIVLDLIRFPKTNPEWLVILDSGRGSTGRLSRERLRPTA